MINLDKKKLAASLSIASNSILILLKLIVGFLSGSISIMSEAVHSMSDLLASILALFAVSKSAKPADETHQFGHGKYEDLSGLIEGILIILAAIFIVYEASKKILLGIEVEIQTTLAITVMGISILANTLVSTYLFRVARSTDSMALFADAEHLKTDIYTSLGVLLGLIAIKITNIHILDPIIAIIVAALILSSGLQICKKATNNLLDGTLPEEENQIIKDILKEFTQENSIKYKNLRTRKSGITRRIELTLLIQKYTSIEVGHKFCDEIELLIEEKLSNPVFLIHLEPM